MSPLARLVDAALFVAHFGLPGALAVGGAGLVLLILGHRGFRPAAGFLFAAASALLVHLGETRYGMHLGAPNLVRAGAAVAGLAVGLALPGVATIAAFSTFGFAAGSWVLEKWPSLLGKAAIETDTGLLGSAVFGAIVAAVLWNSLKSLIPSLVGGILLALGAWVACGVTGKAPELFRLPAVWLALAGVLVVTASAVEGARAARRAKKAEKTKAKTDADAARRREAEQRERYARYLQ